MGLDVTSKLHSTGETEELQYVGRIGPLGLVGGVGRFDGKDRTLFLQSDQTERVGHDNYYVYSTIGNSERSLRILLGLSADVLDRKFGGAETTIRRVNPKAGAIWAVTSSTTLRFAAFRLVKRQLIGNQTIEPTQVAGFDQYFDDANGTISRRVGVAIDQRFGPGMYGGLELTRRFLDVPIFKSQGGFDQFSWRESSARAYLYSAVRPGAHMLLPAGWSAAATVDVDYDQFERPEEFTGLEGFADLKNLVVPVAVRLFGENAFSIRFAESYVSQRGTLIAVNKFDAKTTAWITDFALGYRLPARHGFVNIGVTNLFDRSLELQEIDPANPRFEPHRFWYAKLIVAL